MSNNMNQATHPFWDFVASMQDPRNQSFASAGNQPRGPPPPPPPPGQGFGPFEGQFPWGPWGGMPHRGRDHGRRSPPPPEHDRDGHPGPSGPPPHHQHHHDHKGKGPRGPKPHHGSSSPPAPPAYGSGDEMDMPPPPPHDAEDPPSRAPTPPGSPPTEPRHRGHSPHGPHGPHGHGHGPHGRGGRCGGHGGRGGRWGGRGGHGPGPWGHHGFGGPGGHRHHGPGGPRGPRGQFPFDLSSLIEAFAPGLMNNNANGTAPADRDTNSNNDGMFNPDLDLFDTVEAYILHLSLPGAKKPDLSITYSSTRNSVTISGVVTRPGVDEEMMDSLALDERKVGAFEREVKLEDGVKIDEDGISAKLEDGVLRVVVPKMMQEEDEEYVDVKRIALE